MKYLHLGGWKEQNEMEAELWGSLPGTDTGFLQVLLLILSPGGSIALRLENGLCGEHPFKLKENVSK